LLFRTNDNGNYAKGNINIDNNISDVFRTNYDLVFNNCLVYENINLKYKEHFVIINGLDDKALIFGGIDIDENAKLKPFKEMGVIILNNEIIAKFNIDGDIVYPQNSIDGFKDYNYDGYGKCSHNSNGSAKDIVRINIKKEFQNFNLKYIRFYSRDDYPLPNCINLYGTNEDTFDLTNCMLIGSLEKVTELASRIIRFDVNCKNKYNFYLFNFDNPSNYHSPLTGYWYWNEIEVIMYKTNKFLIKQNNKYYSIKDKELTLLGISTDDVQKKQWFNDYGIDDLREALLTLDENGKKLIDSLEDKFEVRMMVQKD
jgi:hypothetical protein